MPLLLYYSKLQRWF